MHKIPFPRKENSWRDLASETCGEVGHLEVRFSGISVRGQKNALSVSSFDLWSAGDGWVRRLLAGNRMPLWGDVKQWIKAWGEIVGPCSY